ncbi:hypothetical protein V496_02446 [Pseudogymnoascus sp. VKM F-4515 (FW-2607)]|nr:hypothetical protein V496_02446 [Pseudogymnoascus sp. VKM F-4515 (FW-2607)]
MRDEAPVAALSHLVPDSRLLEVHVQASEQTRRIRRGCHGGDCDSDDNKHSNNGGLDLTALDYHPSLIFDNDTAGNEAAKVFAENYLLPYVHEDLQRLANMVQQVPDFPWSGVEFRHVLGISQKLGGLASCTSLLQTRFTGDWAKVDAVVCCEVGGFLYASALASLVDVPLMLIREAGKLPPPTVSVIKPSSHISSLSSINLQEKRIEMERDVLPKGASVVVDDMLSTGETLCAVLRLLDEAGIGAENVSIMVVAELPVHRGLKLLHQRGCVSIFQVSRHRFSIDLLQRARIEGVQGGNDNKRIANMIDMREWGCGEVGGKKSKKHRKPIKCGLIVKFTTLPAWPRNSKLRLKNQN